MDYQPVRLAPPSNWPNAGGPGGSNGDGDGKHQGNGGGGYGYGYGYGNGDRHDGERHGYGPMLGRSEPMRRLFHIIARAAPTDATILLIGESGTGKELVARLLHERGSRRRHPYVPLNCGAIPENLIEAELFGHEKGAFTGASHSRRGVFERAHRGTLLLDEITEMPRDMQVRLLRVIEAGEVTRIGSEQSTAVNVRLIAATNRPIHEALQAGKLREDLLYRLSVFPIHVPPLRDRAEDIELLAEHCLKELNERYGVTKYLTAGALQLLRAHRWPGNVRQLRNVLERAFILADHAIDDTLLMEPTWTPVQAGDHLAVRVGSSLADVERRVIEATLQHCNGDKRRTARTLGISLKTLYNRLNSYRAQGCAIA